MLVSFVLLMLQDPGVILWVSCGVPDRSKLSHLCQTRQSISDQIVPIVTHLSMKLLSMIRNAATTLS